MSPRPDGQYTEGLVGGPAPSPPRARHPGRTIDHVTLHVADVPTSRTFYEALLAPLGMAPGTSEDDGPVVGFFGPDPGSFWLAPSQRDEDRELPIAFRAADRDTVQAFHRAAVIRVICAAVPAWRVIEQAEPEFAGRVQRLFEAGRHKTIATVRCAPTARHESRASSANSLTATCASAR
jgi:catechol 2,3-dioxygenase-like lactoylglutathione lyase family enzyme